MYVYPVYFVITGIVFLWLLYKLFEYKGKIATPEINYVDTSGVAVNPPKFVEVLQNKTINFKIDDIQIKICHLSVGRGLSVIEKIAAISKALSDQTDYKPSGRLDEVKHNYIKIALFNRLIQQIYILSKPFVNNKRKFRKKLFKAGQDNVELILLITEQILDYWIYIKKLLALLGRGATLRQIYGDKSIWDSLEMDRDGTRIIKPRYDYTMNVCSN